MKRILNILYFIALFTALTFGQNEYYMWTGGNNTTGLSWATAFTNITSLNAAFPSMPAGSKIYISGGTDSIVYTGTLEPDIKGLVNNWSVITTGEFSPSPSGHSGKVIIDGNNGTDAGVYLRNGGSGKPSYLKIKGITFRNSARGVDGNFDEAHVGIAIDSCRFENHADRGIIFETLRAFGVDSVFIENNYILSSTFSGAETDGIFIKGVNHTFIRNNWIRVRNQDPVQHVDAIQAYLAGGVVIANNILINDSVYSDQGGGIPIIYGSEGNNPVIIYNNLLYMGGVHQPITNQASVMLTRWYDNFPMPPTWIFNNTCISNGRNIRNFDIEYAEGNKTRIHNNIIAMYSAYSSGNLETFNANNQDVLYVDSTRHNLFYRDWDNDVNITGSANWVGSGGSPVGTPGDWSTWVNTYGGTGVKGDPLLVNNIGHEPDQSDIVPDIQAGSPAINAGEDLTYLYNYFLSTYGWDLSDMLYDIYGNERGADGNWDIGAVEYVDGLSVDSLPNAFTFTDVTNAELSQGYESNGVTLAGFDSAWCYAGGQEFTVYQALEQPPYTWRTAGIRVFPDDIIKVRRTSSSSYSTAINTTLTVGSRSDTYTITTKSAPAPSGGSKVLKVNGGILKDSTGKVIKTQ